MSRSTLARTPYELYIKFLTEYFGKGVEFDPSAPEDLLEPSNPDLPDVPPADLSPDIILSESFV